MIKINSITSTLASELYTKGKFGINTPSNNELWNMIENKVNLYQKNNLISKRVNGNGISKQADKLEKILKSAN